MRIIIEASPGRLASITYYDGIGNQIYPPHTLAINEIANYINNISDEHDIYEIIIAGPKNYTTKIAENLKQIFKNTNFTL